MPLPVTLSGLIYRAQSRADMLNANFVASGEWNAWANSAYSDLYDKISQADPERYLNEVTYTVTSGSHTLPSDFYKLLRVDLLYAGASAPQQFWTLRKFNLTEEDTFSQGSAWSVAQGPASRYRLRDGAIVFTPQPAGTQSIRLLYLPAITPMQSAADTIDGVDGWEEMIVLDMAIAALLKENATDVTPLMAERQRWERKVEALAAERDVSFPETTIDVTRQGGWGGGGCGGGWGGP